MKKIIRFKNIFRYIESVGLALIFALFLSGRVGWFLVLVFLLAPILSVLTLLCFVNSIAVMCKAEDATANKGDKYKLEVKIKNSFILPSPYINITMLKDPCVNSMEDSLQVSVLPRRTTKLELMFLAKICGKAQVGIESIKISDYLGIVSMQIKGINLSEFRANVSVIPDIAEISKEDTLLNEISQAAANADDSEETVESGVHTFGGFPGYDNREYVPGDSLKRINWKLSAKRNKLLVRLDDEIPALSVAAILDTVFKYDLLQNSDIWQRFAMEYAKEEIVPIIAQSAIEHYLGMVCDLVKNGYTVTCYIQLQSLWERHLIINENDIAELRLSLAGYTFANDDELERFPYDELMSGSTMVSVFCTPYYDDELKGLFSAIGGGKSSLNTVVYAAAERRED